MTDLMTAALFIFVIAVTMTMVGKGGGNFYVVILVMAHIPMHEAATTGQFILFTASVAALIIFQKHRSVSWSLAIFIGVFTALSALAGGYFSHVFSGFSLKLIFAVMLVAAGGVMLLPATGKEDSASHKRFGTIAISANGAVYHINLWIALPVTVLTGFFSGMVGVSGGSFLVPLMVLACGIPMHMAVGTASTLIAATSLMGFTGHALQGDFNPAWALPLACVTIIGGIVGGKWALQTRPKRLRELFAYTNWLAALCMAGHALYTRGIM